MPPQPLQVVFPAETVQQGRERQAALLASERLLEQLGEERSRSAALEQVVGGWKDGWDGWELALAGCCWGRGTRHNDCQAAAMGRHAC